MRRAEPTTWPVQERAARSVRLVAGVAAWLLVSTVLVSAVRAALPAPGTTERASLADVGRLPAEGNGASLDASVSGDGRYVAFSSAATNLDDVLDVNGANDVFVRDRLTGATTLVSAAVADGIAPPDSRPRPRAARGVSTEPSISADGRYVAFTSSASDLVDTGESHTSGVSTDVFVRDLVENTTRLVSFSDSDGELAGEGGAHPAISADGRWVAFSSPAPRLGTMESPCPLGAVCIPTWDVHVWDRLTDEIDLVSAPVNGTADSARGHPPDISADGRYVAFDSEAEDLVAGDTNGEADVFVSDRGDVDQEPEAVTRVSVASDGTQLDEPNRQPSLSDDGRRVAFSTAGAADGADRNGLHDIYLRDRDPDGNAAFDGVGSETGITERVSVDTSGGDSDGLSVAPAVSGDGTWVAWASTAADQVAGEAGQCTRIVLIPGGIGDGDLLASRPCFDVFARELDSGATELISLTTTGAPGNGDSLRPSVSFTGQVIGYDSESTDLVPSDTNEVDDVFVRDRPPLLVVAPDAGNFGDIPVGESATLDFTATNVGGGALVVSPADLVGTDPGEFVVTADGCAGQALGHGDTCTVTVTFSPTAPGDRGADLVVGSDVGGGPRQVALRGRGTVAAIEVVPDPADFGSVVLGSTGTLTATVNSVGTVAVAVADVGFVGPDAGDFGLTPGGDSCSGRSLVPGASCTVEMTFTPTGEGERRGELSVGNDAPDGPRRVALTGRGTVPAIEITPDPGEFGSQSPGSSTNLTFTAKSVGSAPLTISDVAVVGAGDFVEGADLCSGRTLATQETCTVAVGFSPAGSGAREATLVFTDDAASSPQAIPLRGTGSDEELRRAAIIVAPDPGDFGSVLPGTSRTLRFTAISAGEAPLSIFDIAVADATAGSFTVVEGTANCPTVALVKGSFCTVEVAFAPGHAGSFTGELLFDHSAADSPRRVALQGLAQAPGVTLDPPLGPPGSVTQVTGTGFRPHADVTLRWDPGIGQATVVADAEGNFEADMLILPGDRLGPRLLLADDGVLSATADELVVPQTTQARQFVTRG